MTGQAPPRPPSSPPCLAAEFAADPAVGTDSEQARDVARWRRAERQRLGAERAALSTPDRRRTALTLMAHLRRLLAERFDGARGRILSAYWPVRGEPDLRPLMDELHRGGVTLALPVVARRRAPLEFRLWTPGTRMERGAGNIPVPPASAPVVVPDIALAPLLGWDGAGYRLGLGSGSFDRTLAALDPRPATIGVGLHAARLPTIFPQPHDIPLDLIVTEAGLQVPAEDP